MPRTANFVKCCHQLHDFNKFLDVHFELYFDAYIATDVTAMLYCESQ